MKAQTTAIVASSVILVMVLASFSGVTYSWFSDSQETEVTVSTGTVELGVEVESMEYYSLGELQENPYFANTIPSSDNHTDATVDAFQGSTTNMTTSSVSSVGITNMSYGDKLSIYLKITNHSTIKVKYAVSTTADANDFNIVISEKSTDVTGTASVYDAISGWNSLPDKQGDVLGSVEVRLDIELINSALNGNSTFKVLVEAIQANAASAANSAESLKEVLDNAVEGEDVILYGTIETLEGYEVSNLNSISGGSLEFGNGVQAGFILTDVSTVKDTTITASSGTYAFLIETAEDKSTTLNNVKVDTVNAPGVYSVGDVTLQDVTVKNIISEPETRTAQNQSAIIVSGNNGSLNVESGYYESTFSVRTLGSEKPVVNISGGQFVGIVSAQGKSGSGGTINISGGEFTGALNTSGGGKIIITGGTFNLSDTVLVAKGTTQNISAISDSNVTISGGTFNMKPSDGNIKDGFMAQDNGDGTWTVVAEPSP